MSEFPPSSNRYKGRLRPVSRLFLSAPMSGLEDHDYAREQAAAMRAKRDLIATKTVDKVFYAGESVATTSGFDDPTKAFEMDVAELIRADLFVLVFPRKVFTSALFELGLAMGRGLDCVVLCRDRSDLPYMLRGESRQRSEHHGALLIRELAVEPEGLYAAVQTEIAAYLAERAEREAVRPVPV